MQKKDFILSSRRLVAIVDFLKWTSTFGEGAIQQMEAPVSGVRLSTGLSRLFGVGRDDAGPMLVMHEKEGTWLEHLPIASAFIGFDDELLVVTEQFQLVDVPFPRVGLSVVVPTPELRAELAAERLLGFGLLRGEGGTAHVERVNKIVPLLTPERYEQQKLGNRQESGNLFSAA